MIAGPFDVLKLVSPNQQSVFLASSESNSFVAEFQRGFKVLDQLPVVDVGPEGVAFPISWASADGADSIELDPVTLTLRSDVDADFPGIQLGELTAQTPGTGQMVISVPGGRRLRAVHMAGLETDIPGEDPVPLRNADDLAAQGVRLAVSAPDPVTGGWAAPVVSVASVGQRGAIPATLTGASFSGSVLHLPDVAGGRLLISLVSGDSPEEFTPVGCRFDSLTGWASTIPKDLTLTGIDGQTLWAFPGELLPGADAVADVTAVVSASLEALRASGQPLTGALTLTAAAPSRIGLQIAEVAGSLLRRIPGTTSIVLEGEPEGFTVPGVPLADVPPTTVVADLHVTYAGMRLAAISDALPQNGALSGQVVGEQPSYRVLPPEALQGEKVTRIGLIGYCPEESALLVRLTAASAATPVARGNAGSTPAPSIGGPGVVRVPASARPGVVWVDLPEPVTVDESVAIEVSVSKGRFRWVGEPDPMVRIVVVDPDPGNRPVVLGTAAAPSTLFTLEEPQLSAARVALPPTAFAGSDLGLASALFCTVEVTDAELRYRRPGV